MNIYITTAQAIEIIIEETIHWTLSEWKDFRSNYNYWHINDDYLKKINLLKTNTNEYKMLLHKYKIWKLRCIIKYKKDNNK
jgi:hypothetical protein